MRIVNTRSRAGLSTTSREGPRRVGWPPLSKEKGPEAPVEPSTTLVSPTTVDAVRTITPELSLEEWDTIQQIRACRADPPIKETSEDSEDPSSDLEAYEVRHP
ncbi:hypothetical protein Droror1_Dr00024617 [Drosera rotundifolia]